jgi:hypothetical protein
MGGVEMKKRSTAFICDTKVQIDTVTAQDANSIWYAPSFMSKVSLPVRKTESNEFARVNGNQKISILAPSSIGLPYGSMPRIVLIWITTQAIITKSPEIYLGSSASSFLRAINKQASGGRNGNRTSFKKAYQRLFASQITIIQESKDKWQIDNLSVARGSFGAWVPSTGEWKCSVVLNNDFFKNVLAKAYPVDQRVIQACSHYPLAIDIYLWATSRAYTAKRPFKVRWDLLTAQFGNTFSKMSNFKSAFKKAASLIGFLYPGFRFKTETEGVLFILKETHIRIKNKL